MPTNLDKDKNVRDGLQRHSIDFCHCEESSVQSAQSDQTKETDDHSRLKRGTMYRPSRGLQMLRLGKRDGSDIDTLAELLYLMHENQDQNSLGDSEELEEVDEPELPVHHQRFRRSTQSQAGSSQPEVLEKAPSVKEIAEPETKFFDDSYLGFPQSRYLVFGDESEEMVEPSEGGENDDAFSEFEKRPMNMLRLGRSVPETIPFVDESDEDLDKRSLHMLRKRPMNMLRLGKRPMNMLRLGKRPMNMLRLGKRPMNMLRLGKRPMDLTDLGENEKRSLRMLRLGKRSTH
ncbi:hypothetical protein Btru_020551 [Bulinus truncatus]|nr:hypothetical protein Btru_020551 [Bulinus truncatus]